MAWSNATVKKFLPFLSAPGILASPAGSGDAAAGSGFAAAFPAINLNRR